VSEHALKSDDLSESVNAETTSMMQTQTATDADATTTARKCTCTCEPLELHCVHWTRYLVLLLL